MSTQQPSLEAIAVTLEFIQKDVADIKHRLDENYVTTQEFEPVKRIVYGLVSLVLVSVAGAVVALVLKS